jgi:hypothetical protein
LLIFFPIVIGFVTKSKKPAGGFAGGLGDSLNSLADLHQAMAVRRHGGPVMMVVTVMAVALHLVPTLRGKPG